MKLETIAIEIDLLGDVAVLIDHRMEADIAKTHRGNTAAITGALGDILGLGCQQGDQSKLTAGPFEEKFNLVHWHYSGM